MNVNHTALPPRDRRWSSNGALHELQSDGVANAKTVGANVHDVYYVRHP